MLECYHEWGTACLSPSCIFRYTFRPLLGIGFVKETVPGNIIEDGFFGCSFAI